MKINLQNYEAYLLDYLEGNLNPVIHRQVENFLELHPEIRSELEELNMPFASNAVQKYANTKGLLKTLDDVKLINENNFEEHCIAYFEEELSNRRKQELLDFVQGNASREALFKLHAQIHFHPDLSIRFKAKKKLLQPVQRKLLPWYISVAAAAAAILLLFPIQWDKEEPPEMHVEEERTVAINKVPGKELQKADAEMNPRVTQIDKKTEQQPNTDARNTIAAFDTNDTRKQEKVILAQLQARNIELHSHIDEPEPEAERMADTQTQNNVQAEQQQTQQQVLGRNRDELIVGAISMGLKGFNNLTENSLAIVAEKDKSGKIKSYSLGNENFGLTKKVRRNL